MTLEDSRDQLGRALQALHTSVVFAESCTAGLCAAVMAQYDGISAHLCGSAVTYMPAVKQSWLNVQADTIEAHTCESSEVAEEMATGAIRITPSAEWAAAVVGHLAADQDRRVYVAIARRNDPADPQVVCAIDRTLTALTRVDRQREAARIVLDTLREALQSRS